MRSRPGDRDFSSAGSSPRDRRVGVVIATRNRVGSLGSTLSKLHALPERPSIVLVDNASDDDTVATVRREYPDVAVVALARNLGGAARTVGVERLSTPYVAFSDDDSWWSCGSLALAADAFDRRPRLGLIAARILVGEDEHLDPTCRAMAASPLDGDPDALGRPILGFVACGAVVRRSAYLQVGGFESRFGVGGEENLVAMDLAATGWQLAYVDEVVAHHHPTAGRDADGRLRSTTRNELLTTWLRRPSKTALRHTARVLREAPATTGSALGIAEAIRELPWAMRNRRMLPGDVEAKLQALDRK